ncbi:putative secreted protein [Peptoclostridium acidaminophilum DSM 3953]|uniref:Putative secreted protein n=1 Tax=Peptoclostridium acidaminophilum DSM 3953 TaxID=1286171 RepID=W8U544_PEPAC|nr:fasciclin domain-containing protein [Peptoclostridium acidaminophilum]AHM56076.1 putative secreted protein [Peptoclostridium acidaminophilum DSM 3953]
MGKTKKAISMLVAVIMIGALTCGFSYGQSAYQLKVNEQTISDAAVEMHDGKTFLPMRFVAEALGGSAQWDAEKRMSTFVVGDKTVALTIDSDSALVNNVAATMDFPAHIMNGRTYVSTDFLNSALSLKTYINSTNMTVKVSNLPDIVETAVGAGSFTTLVAAVQAADLVDVLKSEGPFTVFAPTDEAFAALPEGTVENLLKPENKDQLVSILTYHVVPGKVMAADVVKIEKAATVQGQEVTVMVTDGKVMIDDANVVTTDIVTSNGVIHVIDKVILPK